METNSINIITQTTKYPKLLGYLKLSKLRLGSLVVFSAIITYFTLTDNIQWKQVLAISLGGLLVTSAANGFNQIIEKDLDKLMDRTRLRPMPTRVLTVNEAFIFCAFIGLILGIIGLSMGSKSKKLYQASPDSYDGFGSLNAGYIMSIIGTILGGLYMLYFIVVGGTALAILGNL